MFEPFQKFIPKAANRHGISEEMQAAKVCHDFRVLIPKLFQKPKTKDPSFAPSQNIFPAYFKNSTLVINTTSPAWSQEVIMRKDTIIKEMNHKAGKRIIQNLKTKLEKAHEDF
jgi:hypothetical protein